MDRWCRLFEVAVLKTGIFLDQELISYRIATHLVLLLLAVVGAYRS